MITIIIAAIILYILLLWAFSLYLEYREVMKAKSKKDNAWPEFELY